MIKILAKTHLILKQAKNVDFGGQTHSPLWVGKWFSVTVREGNLMYQMKIIRKWTSDFLNFFNWEGGRQSGVFLSTILYMI